MNHDIHPQNGLASQHPGRNHCRNCNAPASANFCPTCGQETKLHVPSAREFLHEFIGHYVALEGKLWGTMGLLLFRPGRLTVEYMVGHRVRYIQPLRVYLTFSVLFFALIKYGASDVELIKTDAEPAPTNVGKVATAKPHSVPDSLPPADQQAGTAHKTNSGSAKSITLSAEAGNSKIVQQWGPKLSRFWQQPDAEKTRILFGAFLAYMPYAMFCMLPLFALYLKVLYLGSGKRYGEHMLFALHVNAFAFALLGLIALAPWGGLKFLLFVWLACYLPTAMLRVYGGGRAATLVRWAALMATHMFVMLSVIVGTLLFAVVH